MVHVFCSHNHNDAPWIAPLKEIIEAIGHSMYLSECDRYPGRDISETLQAEIKKSDVMIAFLTANSEKSAYVHQEIGIAIHNNKKIIPIVEVGVSPQSLGMLNKIEPIMFERENTPHVLSQEIYIAILRCLPRYDMDKAIEGVVGILLIALLCYGVFYLTTHA